MVGSIDLRTPPLAQPRVISLDHLAEEQLEIAESFSIGGPSGRNRAKCAEDILKTEAWRLYVEQMAAIGVEVEFGVATPEHFYRDSKRAIEILGESQRRRP